MLKATWAEIYPSCCLWTNDWPVLDCCPLWPLSFLLWRPQWEVLKTFRFQLQLKQRGEDRPKLKKKAHCWTITPNDGVSCCSFNRLLTQTKVFQLKLWQASNGCSYLWHHHNLLVNANLRRKRSEGRLEHNLLVHTRHIWQLFEAKIAVFKEQAYAGPFHYSRILSESQIILVFQFINCRFYFWYGLIHVFLLN